MRTKELQVCSAVVGGHFQLGYGLQSMVGLGQTMIERMIIACWPFGIFVVALRCFGEASFLINRTSATEHAFS